MLKEAHLFNLQPLLFVENVGVFAVFVLPRLILSLGLSLDSKLVLTDFSVAFMFLRVFSACSNMIEYSIVTMMIGMTLSRELNKISGPG